MAKPSKETRIKKVRKTLESLCEGLSEKKKAVALPLIEQAAFMQITLADLQKDILGEGCIEEYQNGKNQSGMKATASLQAYNAMVKNFAGICERLDRILPEGIGGSKLMSFLTDD